MTSFEALTSEQSRGDEQSMAASKTFQTAELFKSILLGVDRKTLLLSQRVDMTLRLVITGSSKLQKKLFFKPVCSLTEARALEMVEDGDMVAITKTGSPTTQDVSLINLLILDKRSPFIGCNGTGGGLMPGDFELRDRILRDIASVRRAKSSWERMSLYQPLQVGYLSVVCEFAATMKKNHSRTDHVRMIKISNGSIQIARQLMDEVETAGIHDNSTLIHWTRALLHIGSHATAFDDWVGKVRKLC